MDAKSGLLKNESKSELFIASGDARESANGTTINAFEVHFFYFYLFFNLFIVDKFYFIVQSD